ncbi:MAG TPA: hypothetical protein VKB57_27965 [Acidimicrobiales bacterium]|nr:hypothetical protein [Acidimicrobiales bacterium]
MYHHELSARILIDDRHRELRHRVKVRNRPEVRSRRWARRSGR